ncbi:fimbria/pilus periplasmic chaperone [Xylophilus rhododendri]|uniref:Fimbria/pilus periplasmic chaperone n=1 Tax=Xylophilus rhododendri TaxID=2697032 RepID=A0A857J1N7_9BURK|nr:fimbria/pilus periplasmic chaperone [Xylophilus rhododendri]QHI96785.1 fimbria/pilus periplasmic chaperone [Xylophilus rhododendri]
MHPGRFAAKCLALFLAAAAASAASLAIAPVGLDLPASQKAARLSLANNAPTPLNVQVRVFQWRQVDGQDRLLPTQDVVASPPATTIPPGQTYVIRVARLSPAPVLAEESYRLLIDEIAPAADDQAGKGVAMVLRTSLPVFFGDPQAAAVLQWRVFQNGTELVAEASNRSRRHVKLSDLAARSGDSSLRFSSGLTGYVLPGSTRRFRVAIPAADEAAFARGTDITLTGRAGAAMVQEPVHVLGR